MPELHRALFSYIGWLYQCYELTPDMPLFINREGDKSDKLRPLKIPVNTRKPEVWIERT